MRDTSVNVIFYLTIVATPVHSSYLVLMTLCLGYDFNSVFAIHLSFIPVAFITFFFFTVAVYFLCFYFFVYFIFLICQYFTPVLLYFFSGPVSVCNVSVDNN